MNGGVSMANGFSVSIAFFGSVMFSLGAFADKNSEYINIKKLKPIIGKDISIKYSFAGTTTNTEAGECHKVYNADLKANKNLKICQLGGSVQLFGGSELGDKVIGYFLDPTENYLIGILRDGKKALFSIEGSQVSESCDELKLVDSKYFCANENVSSDKKPDKEPLDKKITKDESTYKYTEFPLKFVGCEHSFVFKSDFLSQVRIPLCDYKNQVKRFEPQVGPRGDKNQVIVSSTMSGAICSVRVAFQNFIYTSPVEKLCQQIYLSLDQLICKLGGNEDVLLRINSSQSKIMMEAILKLNNSDKVSISDIKNMYSKEFIDDHTLEKLKRNCTSDSIENHQAAPNQQKGAI